MARRYHRALDEKIADVRMREQMGTATEEERAWLTQMTSSPQPKTIIDRINAGLREPPVKHPKRPKRPKIAPIQRYRHPYSRRGI